MALKKSGRHEEAASVFRSLWADGDASSEPWDGWNLAWCLRKLARPKDALDVCRQLYRRDSGFEPGKALYAWCIFDVELKSGLRDANTPSAADLDRLRKATRAILKLDPGGPISPVDRAVLGFVKQLLKFSSPRWTEALEWLDRLDPQKLSAEPFEAPLPNGRRVAMPSPLESYWLIRAKTFYHLKRYEDSLKAAEAGLGLSKTASAFWLRRLRALNLTALARHQEATRIWTELLVLKRDWYLLREAAESLLGAGDADRAMTLLVEAALANGEPEKKVGLFEAIGRLLLDKGQLALARDHAALAAALRREHAWPVPSSLSRLLLETSASTAGRQPSDALLAALMPRWREMEDRANPKSEGVIEKVLPNGKAGFIRAADGTTYYFQMHSLLCRRPQAVPGQRVRFRVRQGYDPKRNRPSPQAVEVERVA
jgi:tetratricopeptide (TPR) repeat protein